MIQETAPAKINFYLHVGGLRRDGLHNLASLFVFGDDGDVLTFEDAEDFSFSIEGPFAAALEKFDPDTNLVVAAAKRLADAAGRAPRARIVLQKNLPIAAGVGGGSADAAATLRGLTKLWNLEVEPSTLAAIAFSLGADVPACLARDPVDVTGAGEIVAKGPTLPPLCVCLVNPLVETPTGPIFRAFDAAIRRPAAPKLAPARRYATINDARALAAATRNDLEPFVSAPQVRGILAFLAARPGAFGARMSGSGATCFALFASRAAAERAALAGRSQGWWTKAMALG